MKRIKISVGAFMMLCAMLISDRAEVFLIYMLSGALHELGHLLAAAFMGIRVKQVRFDYSGVRICLDDSLISYKKEMILAASGPMVNFAVISSVLLYFSHLGIGIDEACRICGDFMLCGEGYAGALAFLALSSFIQGASNLLPVRSFDGGRIVLCLSAILFSERASERIIDILSAFSAFILWTLSLYLLLRVSAGIGIYVFALTVFLSAFGGKEA